MALFDPAHPGELIRETLDGLAEETGKRFTIGEVAESLGVTRKTLSALVNGHAGVSIEMALRLGTAFPNTTADFWLTAQKNYDLAQARKHFNAADVKRLWSMVPETPGTTEPHKVLI